MIPATDLQKAPARRLPGLDKDRSAADFPLKCRWASRYVAARSGTQRWANRLTWKVPRHRSTVAAYLVYRPALASVPSSGSSGQGRQLQQAHAIQGRARKQQVLCRCPRHLPLMRESAHLDGVDSSRFEVEDKGVPLRLIPLFLALSVHTRPPTPPSSVAHCHCHRHRHNHHHLHHHHHGGQRETPQLSGHRRR